MGLFLYFTSETIKSNLIHTVGSSPLQVDILVLPTGRECSYACSYVHSRGAQYSRLD